MTDNGRPRNLTTIENAFQIIEILKENDGATLTEVANEFDLAVSTLHDYLGTLEKLGYIVQEGGEYQVGMRFYEIGSYAKRSDELEGKITSVLDEVSEKTGETAWYIIGENGKVVFLERSLGERAVPTYSNRGERAHMHTVAAGKVILAHYPESKVSEILDRHGMPERTENTITNREELFEEFDRIRELGVGFNDEESALGVRAVAAPVFQDDEIIGTISVPGPANRLVDDRWKEEIPEVLLTAINELDLRLRYSD